MPVILFGQVSDGAIEDILNSSDGESALPDSIELAATSLLKPEFGRGSSREDLLFGPNRLRFQSSFQWSRHSGDKTSWNDTWARTRLTTYLGKRLSSDLLAVRRVDDPRMIDELHLTLAGIHPPTNIAFVLGTFQLDWAFGILSSGAYGASRGFSYFRTSNATLGKGIVARTTSREANWLRGAALTRELGDARVTAFGNLREWNANTKVVPAVLSGVLSTTSASTIDRRDKVEERSFGGAFEYQTAYISAGILAQTNNFKPAIEQAKRSNSLSAYGSAYLQDIQVSAEIVRSGSETAWMAIFARGTEDWCGAFYAMYAAPEYFAPRSQGVFTFGETLQDSRIIGGRIGVTRGINNFALDIHSNRTPSGASQSDELTVGWTLNPAVNAELEARAFFANRSNEGSERNTFALRIDPTWTRLLTWSTRIEVRHFNSPVDAESGKGHYLHVQAVRPEGKLRPGARVAAFELDDLDSPMQIYESTVAGAYPLEILSGNGTRVSGWLTIDLGDWDIKTKVAWLSREDGDSTTEFALAIAFR
ncbi:MAG: hypothetical protein IPP40_03300 [bacterium]|nr:hypothetical protein [bacterium]